MIIKREFKVAIVKPNENTGMDANRFAKAISYDGKEIVVRL